MTTKQGDKQKRLLIIDDEDNMRHMLSSLLSRHGYRIENAADGLAGAALLRKKEFEFVLCDIRMPRMDGMAFLREVRDIEHSATIIMMSAYGTVDAAIEAMKLGAYDYISKPFKADEILLVLKKAEERERLKKENDSLRRQLAGLAKECGFGRMVGKSKVMQEVFSLAAKVARHTTTVLITGESGTGKELVARGIHDSSPRSAGPFVAVNCGGIPENLLESEFFGYKKGAFTGADRDKKGLFAEADGGSLFLDEIGELPLLLQVKLLRVLQEGEIRPIGSSGVKKVDVRIIAATAKNLAEEVAAGRFREDLFYRLNVVHVTVPPLRERQEDIPLLCDCFLKKYNIQLQAGVRGISPAALRRLVDYAWPGNVRELENTIERTMIFAEKKIILPEDLPQGLAGSKQERRLDDFFHTFSLKKAQKQMERGLILRTLEATGWNKSKAAELLEISYPSLLKKIKDYSLPQTTTPAK